VYWSGNSGLNEEARRLFETVENFLNNHEGIVYRGAYSKEAAVVTAFDDTSFYLPKAN
jgi:hypothetical protein